MRATTGRSACMSCGRAIFWFDLIPVFSWIWLKGRCRFCACKISAQYPLVELTTAILFATAGASPIPLVLRLAGLPIIAILVAISVYDFRHTIIPDAWVWSFNALALFSVLAFPLQATSFWLPDLLAGPFSALPLFALWLFSGGRWMGLGDAKLALGIGWLLGPFYGIVAVFFSFIIGAIVTVPLLFFSSELWKKVSARFTRTLTLASLLSVFSSGESGYARYHTEGHRSSTVPQQKTMPMLVFGLTIKSEVPFGPFLVASCLIFWFLSVHNIQLPFIWQ